MRWYEVVGHGQLIVKFDLLQLRSEVLLISSAESIKDQGIEDRDSQLSQLHFTVLHMYASVS